MQVPYSEKNIDLNFFNSYAKYRVVNETIDLYNPIIDKGIQLQAKDNITAMSFVKSLCTGVTTKDLLEILENISSNPTETYEYLLYSYIIE